MTCGDTNTKALNIDKVARPNKRSLKYKGRYALKELVDAVNRGEQSSVGARLRAVILAQHCLRPNVLPGRHSILDGADETFDIAKTNIEPLSGERVHSVRRVSARDRQDKMKNGKISKTETQGKVKMKRNARSTAPDQRNTRRRVRVGLHQSKRKGLGASDELDSIGSMERRGQCVRLTAGVARLL